ncbi:MAG: phosphatase [Brevinematales bacterium]|nr:phosphatase [Brevinematales bacterium]
MIEVYKNLFIGDQTDYESRVKGNPEWMVIHACKEPYHKELLGYSGRGAPKEHPEYFFGRRENRLFLNLIDAEDPAYIPEVIIDEALNFISEAQAAGKKCLVHCNQGESRAPSIGLLYLASIDAISKNSYQETEIDFRKLYPSYNPKMGMVGFINMNWDKYTGKRK